MTSIMSRVVVVLAPFLSGLLLVFSLPSFDPGFLAWFSLAPLLFVLRQSGPLAAAGLGFLFGWVFGAGTFYWLNAIPFVTPIRFALMISTLSVYYLAFGLLYSLTNRAMGPWMIVGGPALWVALEYARANLSFLALPWNFLGHSQFRYLPVIQIADIVGVYGISFLIVMVNQLVSELPDVVAQRRFTSRTALASFGYAWSARLVTVVLLLAGTLLYGWHSLAAIEDGERIRVALVQANRIAQSNMSLRQQMEHLRAYETLTQDAAREKPQVIVWPSSSLPAPIGFWIVRLYLNQIAARAGTHILIGGAGGDKLGPRTEGSLPFSNSEFLISPSGRLEGQYNKVHLTPFSEYIPLYGTIKWPRFITSLERSFLRGESYTLFQVGEARFGAPICWESQFPDLFRRFVRDGAQFMVNVTNEGLFSATSAPYQTLAMNVFRAVENRRMIARAATTGVSGFIDSNGKIMARVSDGNGKDVFVAGVLVRDLRLSNKKTFYTLHGDVFAQAAVGAVLLMLLMCALAHRASPVSSPAVATSRARSTVDAS